MATAMSQATPGSPAKAESAAQGRASLVQGRYEADFDVSLVWEVDMILADLPASANALPINQALPLQDKWTLRITSKLDSLRLSIAHGELDNRFLGGVDATLQLRWELPDAGIETAGKLAHEEFDYTSVGSFEVVLRLRRRLKARRRKSEEEYVEDITRRLLNLSSLAAPHDVRFFFPRTETTGLELWANAAMLSERSPFLHNLLESQAVAASPRKGKRPRTEVEAIEFDVATALEGELDHDSDAETDDYMVEAKDTPLYGRAEIRGEFSYRQVALKGVSYTTFRNILQCLQTGYLDFADLTSETAAEYGPRRQYIEAMDSPLGLPVPSSPKSMYRLAHLLKLDDIQKQALEGFEQSLTIQGAACELFSSITSTCPEICELVVKKSDLMVASIGSNCDAVRGEPGALDVPATEPQGEKLDMTGCGLPHGEESGEK
ncbi:hypothetical protein JCM10908_007186 [Rhodotorula pacifica]|uniref:uncharacterized protein n=1 Tax=Rhodotorula pacifica TaxID=1495444 RepID=UPI003181CDB5